MKIGTGIFFTGSSLFQTFSGMTISLVALSFIGPEKMGLWHTALLVKPYLGFAQLGLTEGLGRELPFLMGKEEDKKVKDFASNAQFTTVIYTLLSFLIAIVFTFSIANGTEEKWVFITAGVFISTMFIDNYLASTYRSSRSFKNLAKVYFLSSTFGLLLLPLIFYFEFQGYMFLLLVHSIGSTVLLIFYRPFKIKSQFNYSIYKETIKVGFPMLTLNFIRNIPDTFPKILIVFFISTTALGITAPANAALMAFGVLPAAFAKYIYPKMTYQFGKDNDRNKLWGKVIEISRYFLVLGLIGLLSLLIIPMAIRSYFPNYIEAIGITMIAVGIGFLRMYSIFFNVFNTLKSYKEQFKVAVTRVVLYLLIPSSMFFYSSGNKSLLWIFFGILIAEFFSTIVMFYYIRVVTSKTKEE